MIEIKVGRIVFLLFLSGIIFFFLKAAENGLLTPVGLPEEQLVIFDSPRLDELFNAGTDMAWEGYSFFRDPAGLSLPVFNLRGRMKEKPVTKGKMETIVPERLNPGDFYRQEVDCYEELTAAALKRWEEHLELEVEDKLRYKERQLQYIVQKAVAEKEQFCAEELADFERKIEEQCRARLADLRLKICLPGMTAEESECLEKEILVEEKQMMEKINMKEDELQEKLAVFIEQQEAAAEEELEKYRQQLLREKEARRQEELERLYGDDYRQKWIILPGEGGLEDGYLE